VSNKFFRKKNYYPSGGVVVVRLTWGNRGGTINEGREMAF
tara:strand:- start:45 stop:164 length:120 start_codon:yes stop_codon:yes gene_type:complete